MFNPADSTKIFPPNLFIISWGVIFFASSRVMPTAISESMDVEAIARKWGDSVVVIIPKIIAEAERIRPQTNVKIKVIREDDLSDLFEKLNTKKTPQQLKNEGREGWE